jgi:hypothetical protein
MKNYSWYGKKCTITSSIILILIIPISYQGLRLIAYINKIKE